MTEEEIREQIRWQDLPGIGIRMLNEYGVTLPEEEDEEDDDEEENGPKETTTDS